MSRWRSAAAPSAAPVSWAAECNRHANTVARVPPA
jgi:hypothetical protein